MILVDVSMPVIGKTYEFSLDENTSVSLIIDEIVEIVVQKEGYSYERENTDDGMCMFSYDTRRLLDAGKSLSENGITNGSRLLII